MDTIESCDEARAHFSIKETLDNLMKSLNQMQKLQARFFEYLAKASTHFTY